LKNVSIRKIIPDAKRIYLAHIGPVSLIIPVNPMTRKIKPTYRRYSFFTEELVIRLKKQKYKVVSSHVVLIKIKNLQSPS